MGRARGLWFATGCSGGSSFLYFFAVDVSGFGLGFGFFSPLSGKIKSWKAEEN